MSAISQIVSATNHQPAQGVQSAQAAQAGQANPPIPGMPADTDFGPAAVVSSAPSFEPDTQRVTELWNRHEQQVESFRRMVETLINQQADRQGLSEGFSLRDIQVTPEMRAEAQAMIGEGGYFSVEETAARLLDFAVSLTGGDPDRIDVMRDAVQRGFNQAERMFGGELPEISHQTLNAVMEGFDQWAEAGSVSAITLLDRG